jgi:hypothetical protein
MARDGSRWGYLVGRVRTCYTGSRGPCVSASVAVVGLCGEGGKGFCEFRGDLLVLGDDDATVERVVSEFPGGVA